jgi:rhamnosyltransferase
MDQHRVSIVVRSFNEGWAIADTLEALKMQSHTNWELIVFDSGSTDGSVDIIRRAKPAHFVRLQPLDYKPGRVINQAMELARSDRVIFLNADATPQGPHWLGPLVAPLANPRVAACFGRQIPRPDCKAAFAHDYERCFGFGAARESAKWDHFFSMVSSGLRRDVWALRGFRENMQYSEDDEYTRWCREQGYRVAYCPESIVMHSHNYSPRQAYKRSFGESWALAAVARGGARQTATAGRIAAGWLRDAASDLKYCFRMHRLLQFPGALAVRLQQRMGHVHGYQAGWRMHRVDHVL